MSTIEHAPESHHLAPGVVADQQRRVVLFLILADAIFFACMLFSYFYLRALNVHGGWLPEGVNTAPSWQIWLITAVTVASACAYRSAEMGIRAEQRVRFQTGSLLAIALMIVSIALVIYQANTWGILMSDGSYASMFIVMTGVQLVHLVVVLILGIGIWNRGNQGKLDNGNVTHATVVGYFWYWVTLTGVLAACTSFVVQ
jgi:heme/copper-type cytochrome/quinol oxidase subunit 3